jgi:hypothetical protein
LKRESSEGSFSELAKVPFSLPSRSEHVIEVPAWESNILNNGLCAAVITTIEYFQEIIGV